MKQVPNTVISQLKLVFTLSTLLLLISLIASFYSTQKLISNSQLVNHTNQVLLEAENIISHMKDAETGQRGYLLTLDPTFLEPYNGAQKKADNSYTKLRKLTIDNPTQQRNLAEVRTLYKAKFRQMQRVIAFVEHNTGTARDTALQHREMTKSKKIMDDLRAVVNRIKTEENRTLTLRLQQQQFYITYTPYILLIAALISITITLTT